MGVSQKVTGVPIVQYTQNRIIFNASNTDFTSIMTLQNEIIYRSQSHKIIQIS